MRLQFKNFRGIRAEREVPSGVKTETLFKRTDNGYAVYTKIKNVSDKTVSLGELRMRLAGIDFGKRADDDYFYCNENNRIYGTMTLPVDFDRKNPHSPENARFAVSVNTKWADPGTVGGRICSSPYQPFPAVLIGNYGSNAGLIIGSLSQDVFYHNFETGRADGVLFADIFSSFKGISRRELKAGEELSDAFCILETERADDLNVMFENYAVLLRKILKNNRGAGNANRHTLIWDSWNDGIYRNVSEKMLLEEARVVKDVFPNAEWFQLDDGYSSFCSEDPDLSAHGLGVAYEGKDGVDGEKFPCGLKGYADKVKETGLKPSLWIGGLCPVESRIYRERPEWFVDYTYRTDSSQPLDPSVKEVREYMSYALNELAAKPGFCGLKIDFWSYAFEDGRDLLKNKDKSGYELREWWHKRLSESIPPDGYLQTGCDLCAGNPFLGKYFNNYRFGLDVGAGKWENIITTMFWGMAVLSTHTGDLFVPNSDSIGLLPNLNDVDFMFVVNYQIITRTLVEISGRFSKVSSDDKRFNVIKRAVVYLNNGENVYFPRYDYRKTGYVLPEIAYINSSFDGAEKDGKPAGKTVALFNPGESEKEISFTVQDIGLEKAATFSDVWNGDSVRGEKYVCVLPPHGSRLLSVE